MAPAQDPPIGVVARIAALVIGTFFLITIAKLFASIGGLPMLQSTAWVFVGAFGIIISLAVFCEKYALHRGERRVRLLTLLMLFIPIAIYLTAIHWFLKGIGPPPRANDWFRFIPFICLMIAISTGILLCYGEAMAWLVLLIARRIHLIHPPQVNPIQAAGRIELLDVIVIKRGHFRYESGHHGDLWLDLELLCLRPNVIQPFAAELAKRLSAQNVDAICGPLVEGAFVAMMVAAKLGVDFCYTERFAHPERETLFPVEYRIPEVLRDKVRGRRVAIVNDVISAGSAVRGTAADLKACGANLIALTCLATIGSSASQIAEQYDIPLYTLAAFEAKLWAPGDCPLCDAGVPLTD